MKFNVYHLQHLVSQLAKKQPFLSKEILISAKPHIMNSKLWNCSLNIPLLQVKRATLELFEILFQVSPGVNSYKTCLSSSLILRTNKPKSLCIESFSGRVYCLFVC